MVNVWSGKTGEGRKKEHTWVAEVGFVPTNDVSWVRHVDSGFCDDEVECVFCFEVVEVGW